MSRLCVCMLLFVFSTVSLHLNLFLLLMGNSSCCFFVDLQDSLVSTQPDPQQMEVAAPREFSPKSKQPQAVPSKFKTMESSVKTSAASEQGGNVKKQNKNKSSCSYYLVSRKMLKTFLMKKKCHSWFTRKQCSLSNNFFLSTGFSLESLDVSVILNLVCF